LAIDPLTIESELDKYSAAYSQDEYRSKKHAVHNRWALLRSVTPGTYLDVSCGRGETVALANRIGFKARGTEFTKELVSAERGIEWGHLPELEGIEGADYLSCYEILEHLVPQDVLPALNRLVDLAGKRLWITTNDRQARAVFPDGIYNLHLSRLPLKWWWHTIDKIGKERNILPIYDLWRKHNPSIRNWLLGFDLEQEYREDWLQVADPVAHLREQGYKDPDALYHFWYHPNHPKAVPLDAAGPTLLRNLPRSPHRYERIRIGNESAITYGCSEYMDIDKKGHRNGEPLTAHDAARLLNMTEQELLDAVR
jgi:hypothetical protein